MHHKRADGRKASISRISTVMSVWMIMGMLCFSCHEKISGKPTFLLGWKPMLVLSDSMEPNIPEGSLILVREKQSSEHPAPGDIVLYSMQRGIFVIHRIIGKDSGGYITKGDHNAAADPGRRREGDIHGTVWDFAWKEKKESICQ